MNSYNDYFSYGEFMPSPENKICWSRILDIWVVTRQNEEMPSIKPPKILKDSDWYLLTVNPTDDVTPKAFLALLLKFCKRKTVPTVAMAIETRGTRNAYQGMHAHILIGKMKKSELTKWSQSTFKSIVGNPKHIDVRNISSKDRGMTYLSGYKAGKLKQNHENDVQFRIKHKLKTIYIFNHGDASGTQF